MYCYVHFYNLHRTMKYLLISFLHVCMHVSLFVCFFCVCVWVCLLVRLIHCRPVNNITEKLHPSPKVMADFFQTQNLTWCPYPICTIFGVCIKCMQGQNILTFCINPFCAGVLNTVSVIFFKSSLNIIVNFIEWDLADSDEILGTWFLTCCLNLVQISWRLDCLLQNHSRKSVGHCVRLSASVYMEK